MKKKFTLDEWLKDKSQKLVTAFGEPAKVVFTEGMGNYPILAVIWDGDTTDVSWFTKDGKDILGENQLYFVTEDHELTEFEKAVCEVSNLCLNFEMVDEIKSASESLLALAKKEIVGNKLLFSPKEIQEHTDDVFNAGKAEAQKDLPRWKKMHNGAMGSGDEWNKPYLIRSSAGHYYMSTCVGPDNTYLELVDLEKLPKEDE